MAEGRPGLRLWDRLVLLVSWGVTCGLVFLLGLSVGRGTRQQVANSEERMVRLPVTTAAPAPAPAAVADDVTFYERLVAADRTQERPAAAAPAPREPAPDTRATAKPLKPVVPDSAASAQAAAAAKAVGAATPRPTAKPVTPPMNPPPTAKLLDAAPRATTPPATARPATTPPTRTPGPGAAADKPATTQATAKPRTPTMANIETTPTPPAAKTPPTRVASTTPAAGQAAAAPGTAKETPQKNWTVTLSPGERYEAEALLHQLKAKGYSAAMVPTTRGNETKYRVRIGRYGNSADAAAAVKRLQKDGLQGAVTASTE